MHDFFPEQFNKELQWRVRFQGSVNVTIAVETHPLRAQKLRNELFPGNKLKNGVPQTGNLLPFVYWFISTQGKLIVSVLCPIFSTFPALQENWLWSSLAHVTMRSRQTPRCTRTRLLTSGFSWKCYGCAIDIWGFPLQSPMRMRHSTIRCNVRAKFWKEKKRNQNIL